MLKSFITNVVMLALAIGAAIVLVNSFDAWYHDKENRRAIKRERGIRERHNRYE